MSGTETQTKGDTARPVPNTARLVSAISRAFGRGRRITVRRLIERIRESIAAEDTRPKPGTPVGFGRTRDTIHMDVVVGYLGDENTRSVRGSGGALVVRRLTRGRSKYNPADEDRKHAKIARRRSRLVGGLADRIARRYRNIVSSGEPAV